jgi:putative DNA-invertase from lambdoid prophage Rac
MANLIYYRYSSDSQTEHAQLNALADVQREDHHVFGDDAVSGAVPAPQREGFQRLMATARPGDTVHIAWLDRVMRPESMADAEITIAALRKLGVGLRAHDIPVPDLTADDGMTELVWRVVGAVAAAERRRIRRRSREGIASAQARGVHMGRPASYSPEQRDQVVELASHDRSQRSIARQLGLSARTVGRIIADHQVKQLGDQGHGSNEAPHDAPHSTRQAATVELAIPGRCVEDLRRTRAVAPVEVVEALNAGRKLARGASGYQLLVTATPEVHRLIRQWAPAVQDSNGRKARRKWDAALDAMPQAAVLPEQRQDDDLVVAGGPVTLPLAKVAVQGILGMADLTDAEREAVESATGRHTAMKVTATPAVHGQLARRARTVTDSASVRKYVAAVEALLDQRSTTPQTTA